MSFGRGDLTNPVTYNSNNSYQNNFDDDKYVKLTNQISSSIHTITQNVQDIRRLVGLLGSGQDSTELREKLRDKQRMTNQISKSVTKCIRDAKSLPLASSISEQRSRKTQIERLTSSFSDVLNTFQSIQREVKTAEEQSMNRARSTSNNQETLIDLQGYDQQQQQQEQISQEELQEVQERQTAIRQLESDIVDVNMIFKDLATMVHEQGELVDSIEANVETAETDVVHGNTQLQQARAHQASARKKKFFCFLLLIVLILVIIIVIYVSVKNKN